MPTELSTRFQLELGTRLNISERCCHALRPPPFVVATAPAAYLRWSQELVPNEIGTRFQHYLVPTQYYLVPSQYYLVPANLVPCFNIIWYPQNLVLGFNIIWFPTKYIRPRKPRCLQTRDTHRLLLARL